MIILNMEEFSWGTAEVPEFPNARRLNFLDPESNLRFTMVWSGDPLKQLIEELIPGLTAEQAEALIGPLQLQREAGVTAQSDATNVVDGDAEEDKS